MTKNQDDAWSTAEQQHVAAGTLQAIMSALHPELKRFVRVCVREYMLKGVSMRNSAKLADVDRQVTTLLESKMNMGSTSATTDFLMCLRFVDQNWYKYIDDLDFHSDLRPAVKQSIEIRDNVAHQTAMSKEAYRAALQTFRRLADLIAVQKTTKDLIESLAAATELDSAAVSSSSSKPTRARIPAGRSAQTWIILLLCCVILNLVWCIIVLKEDEKHENTVKSWLPSVSFWTLEEPIPEPIPEPESSMWSLVSSWLPEFGAGTPASTPEPEPDVVASWLGWF